MNTPHIPCPTVAAAAASVAAVAAQADLMFVAGLVIGPHHWQDSVEVWPTLCRNRHMYADEQYYWTPSDQSWGSKNEIRTYYKQLTLLRRNVKYASVIFFASI